MGDAGAAGIELRDGATGAGARHCTRAIAQALRGDVRIAQALRERQFASAVRCLARGGAREREATVMAWHCVRV